MASPAVPTSSLSASKSASSGPGYAKIAGGKPLFAVAAAILDKCAQFAIPEAMQVQIEILLKRFFIAFPKYQSEQKLSHAKDQIKQLMFRARMPELVAGFAQTLAQLALNEILSHPQEYREIVREIRSDLMDMSLEAYAANAANLLPSRALRAVAKILCLAIQLFVSTKSQPLGIHHEMTPANSAWSISLHVQDGFYAPEVKNPADFSYPRQVPLTQLQALPSIPAIEEIAPPIFSQVALDDAQLINKYRLYYQKLWSMVVDDEVLTVGDLMTLYMQFLPADTMDAQQDTELFLSQVLSQVDPPKKQGARDYLADTLTSALALWMTSGQLDENLLFDAAEDLEQGHSSSLSMGR